MTGTKKYLFINEHKDAPVCFSMPIGQAAIRLIDGEVAILTEEEQAHPGLIGWIKNGEISKATGESRIKPRLELVEEAPVAAPAAPEAVVPSAPAPEAVPEALKVVAPADAPQTLAFKVKLMTSDELVEFAKGEYQIDLDPRQTLANLQAEFWMKYEALGKEDAPRG